MKTSNIIWGIALIAFGCLLLLNRVLGDTIFSMSNLWPLFVLVPGLVFEFSYFSTRRNPGVLVPGGILTTIGILFFFETYTNWMFSEYTWPIYILSVAIGLFQLYLFSGRNRGLLVPVTILTTVAAISLLSILFGSVISWLNYSLIGPILFILLGLFILFRKKN